MGRSKRKLWMIAAAAAVLGIALWRMSPEYAYTPSEHKLHRQSIGGGEIEQLRADGADDGTQQADQELLKLGRTALYEETFGNEVFLTDVLGIVDGPLRVANIAKAIAALRGEGTTNLRVALAEDVTLGGRTYRKGELIDTGIDVPAGAYAPLGMPVKIARGRVRVGVSCMACHATVHPKTKRVIEGAPNADLDSGLLMALATNSAAFFTHTDVDNIVKFMNELKRPFPASDGSTKVLPDPEALEQAVDANFVKWPKGSFDSTIDQVSNPAQIPDSFTKGDFPYSWSGFAAAGPFHGLSVFSSNVHAQNSDSLAQAEISRAMFGIDKDVYLGTLLQRAANPDFRYDPRSGETPTAFFERIDPTPGVPGVNEMIKPPTYPKITPMAPDGLFLGSPGFRVGEQTNAMAAYQNKIKPPPADLTASAETIKRGAGVFRRAKCISCHSGDAFTNNKIVPSAIIGTEPSRAKALKKTERLFGEAWFYESDTPVPLPENARSIRVPSGFASKEQQQLAWAHGDSQGGYKVKGLLGLYWTAPYLHDGGVAVGPRLDQLGVPGTLRRAIRPDPWNSLLALVDRGLRARVAGANARDPDLRSVHVTGQGHAFWVDEANGFTKEDQEALISYLLTLKP